MPRKLVLIMTALCFLLGGNIAFAQIGEGASSKVKEKLISGDKKLKKIEILILKMLKDDVIRDTDGKELDRLLEMYGEAMADAALKSNKESGDSAKKTPRNIKVNSVKAVEKEAKKHEARFQKLLDKAHAIEMRVQTGKARLDKAQLKALSPKQRKEFKKLLMPKARKDMEKRHPDIFPPGQSSSPIDLEHLVVDYSTNTLTCDNCKSAAQGFIDFIIPPANAYYIGKTGFVCYAAYQAVKAATATGGALTLAAKWAVTKCIAAAGTTGYFIVTGLDEAKRCSASAWSKWRRIWCWAKFIGILA